MKILVTGGTGYIGSHTCVELIKAGHEAYIIDNLYNSSADVVDKIETITGVRPKFYKADLLDIESMRVVFEDAKKEGGFDAVIHFAGLKAVGESCKYPERYYRNNICGSLNLCDLMREYNVKKLIFSSSACVYGIPETVPIDENFPLSAINPYGATKLMLERIFTDFAAADPEWSVILLRYFNPLGADESGLIGELPNGIPNNLMPYITQVAVGKLPFLHVYGDDYDTPDGTGVRDYIHVVDLAKGHICALNKAVKDKGTFAYNLGTGNGYSVLEVINAFEKANGIKIPYVIEERRQGDSAVSYADASKANKELGWKAEYDMERMCRDSWNFIKNKFN